MLNVDKLTVAELRDIQRALKDANIINDVMGGEKAVADPTAPPFIRPVYDATYNQPGDGGIFTPPGIRPGMFSALIQPQGITQIVQPTPSVFGQERVAILTGQTATVGTNPTDFCGTPVTPGDLKSCAQYYNWGMVHMGSQKFNIDSAGELANRAVTARQIYNRAMNDALVPDLLQNSQIDFMSQSAQAMYQLGTALRRSLAPVMFSGNPATAAASATAGWIKELTGLDRIIKTGYTDFETGNACLAADSTVFNWNADISNSVGGQNITQQITAMTYGRMFNAKQVGMETATWAWVMHPDFFYALTAVYACQYATYRCLSSNAGQPIVQQAPDINSLRLSMINGSYLLIDGRAVPVIQDDAITITAAGGNLREVDAYLMPISFEGQQLLKFEFFNMGNEYAQELAGHFNAQTYVTNNGMYRMYWDRSTSCAQMVLDAKLRMWHDTPFLCARLQNLQYVSQIGYKSPFPGVTGYVDGGAISYLTNPNQP